MSILGVEMALAFGPASAIDVAAQSAKQRNPDSLSLSESALIAFVLAMIWLIFVGFWHIALGGSPHDFLVGNFPRFKFRVFVYAMYFGFSFSFSLWGIAALLWLRKLGQKV